MTDLLRIPPQSVEAEQSVLGGLLLCPDKLAEISLAEDHFYRRDHRIIFRAILDLDAKGIPADAVTLGEWMETNGQAEQIGGSGYLLDLLNGTPSAANLSSYAAIVREKAVLREVIGLGSELVGKAFAGGDAREVVGEAIRALMEITKASTRHESTLTEALKEAWADATLAYETPGTIRGVPFGLSKLDNRLGGGHKGDLIVFGARPAMGKTALVLNFADHASEKGHKVGLISGEQPSLQVAQRQLSMSSQVAAERLRNGQLDDEHWAHLNLAIKTLKARNYRMYDRSAPTLAEVERIARKWKQVGGLDVLYVDYVQRIRYPKAGNRTDEVGYVAAGLKNIARDLEIPVIALAQVKRDVETRQDKRPLAGDLANSDELTREADSIIMLYRDEVYDEHSTSQGIAELNVEKNRHGPLGLVKCRFFAETMRFRNLAEESA